MFHRCLNILLAAGIFACPLVCRGAGQCCGNEPATLRLVCCEGCGANPAHHDRDRGNKPQPRSDNCCQCICGGAVVEADNLQLNLDGCDWPTPLPALHFTAVISQPQLDFVGAPPLPDDDMNPGRALRCRIMSFLC